MREAMPLPPSKKGVARAAIFQKGKITDLEDDDYKFLNNKDNSMLPVLVEMGVFVVVAEPAPKVDTKQKKKDAKAAKAKATKDKKLAAKKMKGN